MENTRVEIKDGKDLSPEEIEMLDKARVREWQSPPLDSKDLDNIFFLLKSSQNEILAQGELTRIDGVIFDNKTFNILGIGGIISNIKGQGYGRQLMSAIRIYLNGQEKTGLGFTRKPVFYEKCGFKIDKNSLHRFVHQVGTIKNINTNDEYVLYIDSKDKFMEKVLAKSDQIVSLPLDPAW